MGALVDEVLDVDPSRLSHDDRLDLLERIEHSRSALDALQQQTLALLARDGDALARSKEWVREEVACVLRIAPATAAAKLYDATEIVQRLPRTLDRLTDGSITLLHARALVDQVRSLDDDTTANVEARVLERATEQTIGRFRQTVKRAAHCLDPRSAETKHHDALTQRGVTLYPEEDGMATICAYLPADGAQALLTSLDGYATQLDDASALPRTADQKRADVLIELTELALAGLSTRWQGSKPSIQVSVALSTLLGLDDQPAELDGYGPVPASMARRIAADPTGTWRRIVTDPTGRLLDYGHTSYRPPPDLREHVIATDQTCRFPGCRRRARRCEIDHRRPFDAGGRTDPNNLQCLCPRHHRLKHETGWHVTRSTDATAWISPAGRRFEQPDERHPIDRTAASSW